MKNRTRVPQWFVLVLMPVLLCAAILFLRDTVEAQGHFLRITDSPALSTQFAYVTIVSEDRVSVIDTASDQVVNTIAVGDEPRGIAVHPTGCCVYVTNYVSNNVSVINTANNKVVATIPVGSEPWDILFSPDGSRAYVSNVGSGTISVLNTTTNTIIATIPLGANPSALAISRDGSRLYVSRAASQGLIWVVDTTTNRVVKELHTCGQPASLELSPDGSRLYVTIIDSGEPCPRDVLTVLDTSSDTEICTAVVGDEPHGIVLTPDGAVAYVSNSFSDTVTVVDATNCTIKTAAIQVGGAPYRIEFSPNLNRIYVANFGGTVSVIDTTTNQLLTTIRVGGAAQGVAITPLLSTVNTTITIRKDTQPDSMQDFTYYGPFGKFYLDDPQPEDGDAVKNIMSYTVNPGIYNFAEGVFQSWHLANIVCTGNGQSSNNLVMHSVNITVKAGDQMLCTFITQRRVNLEALIYNDLNANHMRDANEPPLRDWEFRFYKNDGTLINRKVSDATGSAKQSNVIPGSFKICETPKAGWTNTQSGGIDPVLQVPCYQITLYPGENYQALFGVTQAPVVLNSEAPDSSNGAIRSELPDINELESEEPFEPEVNQRVYLPLVNR